MIVNNIITGGALGSEGLAARSPCKERKDRGS